MVDHPAPVHGLDRFCSAIPDTGIHLDDYLDLLGLSQTAPTPSTTTRTLAVTPLKPVQTTAAGQYLSGINTKRGGAVQYQHRDGGIGSHTRRKGKVTRNPGIRGSGWQVRRWNPLDVGGAGAIIVGEGEKDAAIFARRGYIAFSAPRGAQSLPQADFQELLGLADDTALPVILALDNDAAGRKANGKVKALLLGEGLTCLDLSGAGPHGGSIADLQNEDMNSRIAFILHPMKSRWLRPRRTEEYLCHNPTRRRHTSFTGGSVAGALPCEKCPTCERWQHFLHVERCHLNNPVQAVIFDGIGTAEDTLENCISEAEQFRRALVRNLQQIARRGNEAFPPEGSTPPYGEKASYMSATGRNPDTYLGRLTLFLTTAWDAEQLDRLRLRHPELQISTTAIYNRQQVEDLAPPTLAYVVGQSGRNRQKVNAWTADRSWPNWEKLPSAYDLDDGTEVDTPNLEDTPMRSWKATAGLKWDNRLSLAANLQRREDVAHDAATAWMEGVSITLEDFQAIAEYSAAANPRGVREVVRCVVGYRGPTSLLSDAADYYFLGGQWRKAYLPVLANLEA